MPYDPERHGPRRVVGPGFHARVYDVVRKVPPGRVTTYGAVAGAPRAHSRPAAPPTATRAHRPEQDDVPWHRVVNAQGKISPRGSGGADELQRLLLEEEGVHFDDDDRIDLARFGWSDRG